jgi:hypothetical protein
MKIGDESIKPKSLSISGLDVDAYHVKIGTQTG